MSNKLINHPTFHRFIADIQQLPAIPAMPLRSIELINGIQVIELPSGYD
jgi:hypothetical protein